MVTIGKGEGVTVTGIGVADTFGTGDGVMGVGVGVSVFGTSVSMGTASGVEGAEHAKSAPTSIRTHSIC